MVYMLNILEEKNMELIFNTLNRSMHRRRDKPSIMSSRWDKVQRKPQSYANLLLITEAVRTTAVVCTKEGHQLNTSIKEDF